MRARFRTVTIAAAAIMLATVAPACTGELGTGEQNQTEQNSRTAAFEIFVGQDGQYYFHLKAGNGEIVLASEAYQTEQGADNGIESVKAHGVELSNYEIRESADDQFYFVLIADNNEIIGVSETYVSRSNAERGVDTVQALIVELLREEAAANGGAHFDIFVGDDGQYYFHLQAANGEIVLASEAYVSKQGAANGVASVRENGKDPANYEISNSVDDQFYFVLKGANGEIIGVSETYVSQSNAEQGVATVVALLRSEKVADSQ